MGTTTIGSTPNSSITTRSTSPRHVDSIISTRQRRQNAGNRLRQLLNNLDEPLLGYEDEDGQNIFQEVEGDNEYDVNATESEEENDYAEEDDDEDNADSAKSATRSKTRTSTSKRRNASGAETRSSKRLKLSKSHTEESDMSGAEVDDDDMFSGSSESEDSPDEDDSAGEKEYLRGQRAEARQAAKKKRDNFMPAAVVKAQQRRARIDQAAKNNEKDGEADRQHEAKRHKLRMSADQLMSENRRRSTRKAAIKNAEDVLQRLKESEVRRAKMPTPVAKVVHTMTQEERLKEAVETEKKNVESLNDFYKNEEDRRKDRRAMLLAKRAPMKSFIRYVSKTTFVEPSVPLIQEIVTETAKPVKKEPKRKKDVKPISEPVTETPVDSGVQVGSGAKGNEVKQQIPAVPNGDPSTSPHEKPRFESHMQPTNVGISLDTNSDTLNPTHNSTSPIGNIGHAGVDMINPIDIGSTISSASSSHTVTNVTDTPAHPAQPSPPSHMVIDPATGNPYDTLSPVSMNFTHHDEQNFRRSTSVEQLEADYINFHVAEEPSEIGTVPILPEPETDESALDLVKNEHRSQHIIPSDINLQIASTSNDDLSSKYSVPSALQEPSPASFPMSEIIISDVNGDGHKANDIQTHKPELDTHVTLDDEQTAVVIPANYSSNILATSSAHTSAPISTTQSITANHIMTSSVSTTISASSSMDLMKSQYDPTLAEHDILHPQPHVIDEQESELKPQAMEVNESENLHIAKVEGDNHHDEPVSQVVQGPPACRAIATIGLMEFPENFQYSTPEIQKVLFGPQSLDIPIIPADRSSNITKTGPTTIITTGPGRKKRAEKVSTKKSAETTSTSKKETGKTKQANAAATKSSAAARLSNVNSSLESLTSNPLFSRGFGMKVGTTGLSVSGTSVGPLGTGVIGSGGGGGPGGLSAAAANAAAAAAAAAAANGGLVGGSAAARAKSAAALAALQQAPKCVITGKSCKFVDPKSGLPYSSMEAFQMIRQVINFEVPWNKDFGIFMGAVGKEMRHAKGVPPGFSGVSQ